MSEGHHLLRRIADLEKQHAEQLSELRERANVLQGANDLLGQRVRALSAELGHVAAVLDTARILSDVDSDRLGELQERITAYLAATGHDA